MIRLYNSLTNKKENFIPLNHKKVGLYTCGLTVYNYAHIGNLRTYVFEDILKRVIRFNGYQVKHVMNITDVGHLTDDADHGEDKIEKAARKSGRSAEQIADFYTKAFKKDLKELNIQEPDVWCRASEHIPEQINLVKTLIDKGVTYQTEDGIYFDTGKISDYGKLTNLRDQQIQAGARIEMGRKKNPHDFALWKFSPADSRRQMEWEAFGRKGFPGWHLECSAMSMKYLGEQFDIHCGGVDHMSIHHNNEIAQSEAATGIKPWVKYWLHGEFLLVDKNKMAKSADNFITLDTLKKNGYQPLSYRYLLLQTHYRKQLHFSYEALDAAQSGLERLYRLTSEIRQENPEHGDNDIEKKITEKINDDLNIPEALALVWDNIKQRNISFSTLLKLDRVLGLNLDKNSETTIEPEKQIQSLLDQRAQARQKKDWHKSDRVREQIERLGYKVEDTDRGQKISRIK